MYEFDISIVILNWNTARRLDGCIESLLKNAGDVSFEAYVIDNNSKGDGFDKVVSKYRDNKSLIWIKNKENIGGIATNRVFPKLKGRYVMLLGNDTIIMPGCFRNLVDFMDRQQDAGAVSAKLLNPDGSVQNYYARFHDLPMFFWRATLIGSAIDKLIFRGEHARYYWYSELDPEKLNIVDQPPAPCLLIRRAQFNKEYFIDEQISLFFADVDLCRRIYDSGYKIYVLPTAQIIHFPGSSFKKADPKWAEIEYRKSLLWYFNKYYPRQVPVLKFLLFADALPQFVFKRFQNQTINFLRQELADCDSILDLGCGYDSPIQYINTAYSVGVELHEPYLRQSDEKALHTKYIMADIRKIEFENQSFDGVMMLDVLEHLTKEEAMEMIGKMQQWARKKVIITVPNGNVQQKPYDNNIHQEYKSHWSVGELRSMNFKVRGFGGWKILHGEKGEIRYKPKTIWKVVSFMSLPVVDRFPCFALLLGAVRDAGEKNQVN